MQFSSFFVKASKTKSARKDPALKLKNFKKMKKLKTVIAALGVFAMTIGSGFAMDINPPTEPIKGIVETEFVEEAPQQALMGYGYKDGIGNCILISEGAPPTGCSIMNSGPQCTITIGTNIYNLYLFVRATTSHPWNCVVPLREP